MTRRRWKPPLESIPASPLCQVVTGEQGSASCDDHCDCYHAIPVRSRKVRFVQGRRVSVWSRWYVCVDNFTGIAVTYHPVHDEELGHEIITEPELARLLR